MDGEKETLCATDISEKKKKLEEERERERKRFVITRKEKREKVRLKSVAFVYFVRVSKKSRL